MVHYTQQPGLGSQLAWAPVVFTHLEEKQTLKGSLVVKDQHEYQQCDALIMLYSCPSSKEEVGIPSDLYWWGY